MTRFEQNSCLRATKNTRHTKVFPPNPVIFAAFQTCFTIESEVFRRNGWRVKHFARFVPVWLTRIKNRSVLESRLFWRIIYCSWAWKIFTAQLRYGSSHMPTSTGFSPISRNPPLLFSKHQQGSSRHFLFYKPNFCWDSILIFAKQITTSISLVALLVWPSWNQCWLWNPPKSLLIEELI